MASPWPRGLRSKIHKKNDPLAELPAHHPAKRFLIRHAQCWQACAGREIPWPGHEDEAVDQVWTSETLGAGFSFSGFIYAYVCFHPILHEWLERPTEVTEDEKTLITKKLPMLRSLLAECEEAAQADANQRVLAMTEYVRVFLAAWEKCVRCRIDEDGLQQPDGSSRRP